MTSELVNFPRGSRFSRKRLGAFSNYVDKMRGEGVKKILFLFTLMISKQSTQGGGVQKWQNSVHVIVE